MDVPIRAQRIRQIRTELGYDTNQQGFADLIGVSRTQLSRWENGEQMRLEYLEKLADVSGRSIDWIMGRDAEQGGERESHTATARRNIIYWKIRRAQGAPPEELKALENLVKSDARHILPTATAEEIQAMTDLVLRSDPAPTLARADVEKHREGGGK